MFLSKSARSAALSGAAPAGATGLDVPSTNFYDLLRATDSLDESSE